MTFSVFRYSRPLNLSPLPFHWIAWPASEVRWKMPALIKESQRIHFVLFIHKILWHFSAPSLFQLKRVLRLKNSIYIYIYIYIYVPVGRVYRIHWLYLGWEVTPLNNCPGYDIKLHLMVRFLLRKFEECRLPFLLPLHPGPLWPGLIVPVRVLSVVQMELFNHLQKIIIIINSLFETIPLCANHFYYFWIHNKYFLNRIYSVWSEYLNPLKLDVNE